MDLQNGIYEARYQDMSSSSGSSSAEEENVHENIRKMKSRRTKDGQMCLAKKKLRTNKDSRTAGHLLKSQSRHGCRNEKHHGIRNGEKTYAAQPGSVGAVGSTKAKRSRYAQASRAQSSRSNRSNNNVQHAPRPSAQLAPSSTQGRLKSARKNPKIQAAGSGWSQAAASAPNSQKSNIAGGPRQPTGATTPTMARTRSGKGQSSQRRANEHGRAEESGQISVAGVPGRGGGQGIARKASQTPKSTTS